MRNNTDRSVVVAQSQYDGEVVRVLDSWDDFDAWLDQQAVWEKDDLRRSERKVGKYID